MGRERNRPKVLFNYFGWQTFWYRDNFGLLRKHRDVSLYHLTRIARVDPIDLDKVLMHG